MDRRVVPISEHPELQQAIFSDAFQSLWPEYMRHDPAARLYFDRGHFEHYRECAFACLSPEGEVAARAFSVPFAFADGRPERTELPDGGWDAVIRWAHQDRLDGCRANALSALEILVRPEWRGRGIARLMLETMRETARARGCAALFAPVRPTEKDREPELPFADYAARRRADGLPADPWLRLHARAGGEPVKIGSHAMVIPGSLAEWSRWTGMRFARSGAHLLPGGLVPLQVSVEHGHAVYVEPCVWIRHAVS